MNNIKRIKERILKEVLTYNSKANKTNTITVLDGELYREALNNIRNEIKSVDDFNKIYTDSLNNNNLFFKLYTEPELKAINFIMYNIIKGI